MCSPYFICKLFVFSLLTLLFCEFSESAEKIIVMHSGHSDSDFLPIKSGLRQSFYDLPIDVEFADNKILIQDYINNRMLVFSLEGEFIKKLIPSKITEKYGDFAIVGSDITGNCVFFRLGFDENNVLGGIWDISTDTYDFIKFDFKSSNRDINDFTFPFFKGGYLIFYTSSSDKGFAVFDKQGRYVCDTDLRFWSDRGVGMKFVNNSEAYVNAYCFTHNGRIDGEIRKEVEFRPHNVIDGVYHNFLGFDKNGRAYYASREFKNNLIEYSIIKYNPFEDNYKILKDDIPYYNGIMPMLPQESLLQNGDIIVCTIQPTQSDAVSYERYNNGFDFELLKPEAIQVHFWKLKF